METPDANSAARTRYLVLGLLVLTIAVFWRVSGHDFIRYDDPDYVTANVHVNRGLTTEGLAWAFGNLHGSATYWHPLTWVSHMIDCQLFGLRPGPHHLVNLGFHLINVVLLFLVLRRMTGDFWPSAITAALWAVHPFQVDTVAWVTERKNLLSTLFWLLAMAGYARYAERPTLGRYALVFLAMAVGLMTKPILVTLPCALLLLDFWPLRRWRPAFPGNAAAEASVEVPRFAPRSVTQLLVEKLPLLALSIASSVITVVAHEKLGSLVSGELVSFSDRLQGAAVSYARYLGKTVLPVKLAVFYPNPGQWPLPEVLLSVALLVGLTGLAVWACRRAPSLAIGWFWFLGVMVPTIGIVAAGSQSIADRFMYLPLLGLLIAVVWGGRACLNHFHISHRVVGGVAGGLIFVLAAMSSVQVRHWQNTSTLFTHAMKVTQNNYIAYAVVGTTLHESGRTDAALPYVEKALELKPDHFECRHVLANIYVAQKRTEEAFAQFARVVETNPRYADGFNSWAAALAAAGRFPEALTKVDEALRIHPDHLSAHLLRPLVLQRMGRMEDAAVDARKLLQLQPTNTTALVNLGNGFMKVQRPSDALPIFQYILRFEPDSVEAMNRVAWIYATHQDAAIRQGAEALRLATRACELTGRQHPLSLNTLAAAYAETGQFEAAVATATQALQLATKAGLNDQATVIQKLLDAYKSNTPHRE